MFSVNCVIPKIKLDSFTFIFIIAVLFLFCCNLNAATWYVDADINTPGTGSSWENPLKTIDQAISAADTGDQIWIKTGTYELNSTLSVPNDISIFGGFAATESEPNDRQGINFANETTIVQTANDLSVMQITNGSNIRIDGFTLKGANGASGVILNGCDNSVILVNCRIKENVSPKNGAGLRIISSDPILINCKISNNNATSTAIGGGLYIDPNSAGTYSYCIISDNTVDGNQGGGAFIEPGTGHNPYFYGTTFIANESQSIGSGIYAQGVFELKDCYITANRIRSTTPSGAVYLYGAGTNVTFSGNSYITGNAYDINSLKEYAGISGTGSYTIHDSAIVNEILSSTTHAQFLQIDVKTVMYEAIMPPISIGDPAAGKKVKQTTPDYNNTNAYHSLYLPTDWQPGHKYPVFVGYPGNGPYRNRYADRSGGMPEDTPIGYGLSGGKGFILIGMPYIDSRTNMTPTGSWWGDVQASVDYCLKTVKYVCENYGGDQTAVFLTGFSRSAIGTGFIGRYTPAISDIWLGFISYDGWDIYDYIQNNTYNYPNSSFNYDLTDSNGQGEVIRFERIKGRENFILNSGWAAKAERLNVDFNYPFTTYRNIYRNHNASWANRGTIERQLVKNWVDSLLANRTAAQNCISGTVNDQNSNSVENVLIETNTTHYAYTDANGFYHIEGLIDGNRPMTARKEGFSFFPTCRTISLSTDDRNNVDWIAKSGFMSIFERVAALASYWLISDVCDVNGQDICLSTSPADHDGDCFVNFTDYCLMPNYWVAQVNEPVIDPNAPIDSSAFVATAISSYAGIDPNNAVNGTGLTGNAHSTVFNHGWCSGYESAPANWWFKVKLGSQYQLEKIKLFNSNWAGYTDWGIKQADIYVSNLTSDPGNPVDNPANWTLLIENQTFTQASGRSDYGTNDSYPMPDMITFPMVLARWVAIKIDSSLKSSNETSGYVYFSEVQFFGKENVR